MYVYLKKYLISKCKDIKKIKKQYVYIIVASIIFCILSFVINKKSIFYKDNLIKRSGYGDGKTNYSVDIDIGKDIKKENIVFSVSDKKYKESEIDEIFEYAFDECVYKVLGKNSDFSHVDKDLYFFNVYKEGIDIVWDFKLKDSEDFEKIKKYYRLIEDNGKLNNQLIDEEYVEGYLTFYLKASVENKEKKVRSDTYNIPITILPKTKNDKELLLYDIKNKIIENDKKDITTDYIKMPKIIDDKKVKYVEKIDMTFLLIPIIGIFIIILLEFRDKNDIKEKEKKRKRVLLITYPKLVNKLLIYISSGMTIRNSIIKMADDYKNRVNNKIEKENIVFDKLCEAKNNLSNGEIEAKVYEKMSKDMNDRKYSRFFNILIQNIKNGTKDFREILTIEAYDSLQEKKNNAKKLGEEAATKLIIPLLLELMIVMFVIIVPAFMGM